MRNSQYHDTLNIPIAHKFLRDRSILGEDAGRGITQSQCLSPWERRPERSDWTESIVFQRLDGSCYEFTRWASRWAGLFACGEWIRSPE
jgi:hypothetical protein